MATRDARGDGIHRGQRHLAPCHPPFRPSPDRPEVVFKVKRDERGAIIKHKVRLGAKVYVQRYGVDYDEVFAPVARLESIRLLLALAGHEGWAVHHMDVKTAFLNVELNEEVYVDQPPGFKVAGRDHKAMYARGDGTSRLLVGMYVDDLIITGNDNKEISWFMDEMASSFKMSDLGLLTFYLGIEVHQDSTGITINQSAYALKILEKCGMADCNPSVVPMESRLKLSKKSMAPPADTTLYRSIVGSLRYLVHTRPDIAYVVGYVSRFMENPTTEHMSAVKHVLRYIAGTRSYGCHYGRKMTEPKIIGYIDSDMADDVDDRKSTTGVLFFLESSPITWQSRSRRSSLCLSVKRDERPNIIKHKAHLVAKGYVQRYGVDYDEVFAPVARLESVRLLLALAGHEGCAVHHMDVKTAFLNGDLNKEVYVDQSPGFKVAVQEHKVLRLQKALYCLKQAPRAWNAKRDARLSSFGFMCCPSEQAMYAHGDGTSRLLVGVYVDDLIITGNDNKEISRFKDEMASSFKMSDLGLLTFYLGIEVHQDNTGITIN
ncbi:hypothetical protein QYE76_047293 [Lolium multiflorum]|uniref:Reverse transcriptase Ty1/copia-type domain-containing protein n=1 Tax=Lolium multiflorum TaxID=4521 RepID=A0AAD8WZG4_LOLMU|nr:hypothetical protein QYE76_047293 [Lolium multiflorum]